jgi:hypothetical protein
VASLFDQRVVADLIAGGLDVNARNKQGRTPLHVAVEDINVILICFAPIPYRPWISRLNRSPLSLKHALTDSRGFACIRG